MCIIEGLSIQLMENLQKADERISITQAWLPAITYLNHPPAKIQVPPLTQNSSHHGPNFCHPQVTDSALIAQHQITIQPLG
jgi:hypothetical protein